MGTNMAQAGTNPASTTTAVQVAFAKEYTDDEVRLKAAWALSQIFVVSINKTIWNDIQAPYEEMLMADAFTLYGQPIHTGAH